MSIVAAITLALSSAFTAALAFGAVALVVPGTGTPDANKVSNYMEQARDRYLTTTACGVDGSGCPDGNLHGIDYPASFWPLVIFPSWCRSGPDGCDKWDESVGKGTANLQSQLDWYLDNTDEDIVIFGYSQGGAVVSNVLAGFNDLPSERKQEVINRVQIVTIGGIQTPDGGLWSRLAFLRYVPILDVTLTPAMTPNTGVNYTSYAFHFDPVADAPRYWGNPFALLNAVAALETVHGYYLSPNGNGPDDTLPYGYDDTTLAAALVCKVGENCRVDQWGNKYVVIPATSLPIADFILSSTPALVRPLIKPFVDLVAPAYRVLAELGYDYSGDPSTSTPLSILPFNPFTTNPIKVTGDLVAAVIQGIQDALGDVATTLPGLGSVNPSPAPSQPAAGSPLTTTQVSLNQLAQNQASPNQPTLIQPSLNQLRQAPLTQDVGLNQDQPKLALVSQDVAQPDLPTPNVPTLDGVKNDVVTNDVVKNDVVTNDVPKLDGVKNDVVKKDVSNRSPFKLNGLAAKLKERGDALNGQVRGLSGQRSPKNETTQDAIGNGEAKQDDNQDNEPSKQAAA